MVDDALRKRIEALNKKPLRNVPDAWNAGPLRPDQERARLGEPAGASAPNEVDAIVPTGKTPADATPGSIDEFASNSPEGMADGVFAKAPAGPGYCHIELPAQKLDAGSHYLHRRFISLTGYPNGNAVARLAAVRGAERLDPDEILFLDIETTGLGARTPLFLIGTMECTEYGFVFRQYFARNYAEEPSVIAAASERLKRTGVLITFNGKSFDLPFIEGRAAANGLILHYPGPHLDILHEARSRYRGDLPNCRLQTLEQMVCGRFREEDIPSAEIPEAYHEFVRTGNTARIRLILRHNLFDLLTMADLLNRMWGRD
ncbi:MAG: ribonuclease H-like domain-containing protein [Armatimonadota bacterium]